MLSLVIQTLFLTILPIAGHPETLEIFGTGVYLVGLVTAILGRVQLGRNWKDIEDTHLAEPDTLVTDGIYAYIRHPIYVGDMLLLVGLEIALNSCIAPFMVFPVFVFARLAFSEEAKLARKFQDYAAYCRQTKRFVPFVF